MQRNIICTLLCLLSFYTQSIGQDNAPTSKDSISTFFNTILDALEEQYVDRETTDWPHIRALALDSAFKASTFEGSLDAASLVFDSLACNHCILFAEEAMYGSSLNQPLGQEDFSRPFLLEYEKKPAFSVKVIDDNIGYILIPGMLLIDLPQEELDQKTQEMYDQVVAVAKQQEMRGWIIDLRFNIGGNVYPMLASLHYLLGDNLMYNAMDANGKVGNPHTLKDGGFYSGDRLETKAEVSMKPNTKVPVSLLIGKMTGSAGEDIAIAFKIRGNSTFIGEESYGFLTLNDLVELPYGIKVALTTSYTVDEKGVYRKTIQPDRIVQKKDNFEDQMKDGNIIEAIRFIDNQKK
ncbi:MAG: S41 family peptidase [Bacteroidota bacterium]